MENEPLNTFAIISFNFGDESTSLKYEKFNFKKNELQQQSFSTSAPAIRPDTVLTDEEDEDIQRSPFEKVYWIILEDGELVVEEYLSVTLVEQIDNLFAGPFTSKYGAELFLRNVDHLVNGESME